VWVFDGADPFARWELHARQQRGRLRRAAWGAEVQRRERFLRGVLRQADAVFAHNRAVQERFAAEWGPRCHLFERSFVTEALLLGPEELAGRLERLERDPVLRVAMAGRQIRIKGTDQVLRALARARAAGARVELDVWGDGDDLPEFRGLARDLGLDGSARFHGPVPYGPELFEGLARTHLLAVTNLTPELSRNVLLALARGLPLVSYGNPGTDALLGADRAGLLVPTGDVEALAAALVRGWQDRALLRGLAERGRAVAGRHTLEGQHRERARLAAELAGLPACGGGTGHPVEAQARIA
jgi:glycosyltransferase involved in cell wall biosynthesis